MFLTASVRLFICQHDNFRTIKYWMIKLCIKISPQFEFGCHSPPPRVPTYKTWHFAQSLLITQKINQCGHGPLYVSK